MASRASSRILVCGVVFCLMCAGAALAQVQPPASPPANAVQPTPPLTALDFPWETVVWVERRYKIEALRFKARDETGIDWFGSDEVMVGTNDAKGSTVSDEIGDIDSGDTHHFDPLRSCIIAVRPGVVILGKTSVCTETGEPAPFGFNVEFWEKDPGILSTGFCVVLPPQPDFHAGPHCPNDGRGDDFIGHARVDFTREDLEAVLPTVGSEFVETVVLHPCEGDSICAGWDLPDYSFTYRITRLPDVRVDLRTVLDEAMRQSGARTELEAIVDGLRKLSVPRSRNFRQPETTQPSPR